MQRYVTVLLVTYLTPSGRGRLQYPLVCTQTGPTNLGVSGPDVDLFLGQVTLVRHICCTQVDADVLGDVEVGATLVVVHVLDWKQSHRTERNTSAEACLSFTC